MEKVMLSIKELINCSEECYAHVSVNGKEKETLYAEPFVQKIGKEN